MAETATQKQQKKRVEVLVDPKHAREWERVAAQNGQELSSWIRSTLIAAARDQAKK